MRLAPALAVLALAACTPVTTGDDATAGPSGALAGDVVASVEVQAPVAAPGVASPAAEAPTPAPDAPLPAPTRAGAPEVTVASSSVTDVQVAPAPVRLQVERLGIDMEIVGVGYAADGGMELPATAATAGWFRLGGNPSGGLRADANTVVAAHVDDPSGLGPFAALREARPGDRVVVTDASGATWSYTVERVEQTSKPDVDFSAVFARDGDPRLVLVTCGGRWDAGAQHYEDNVMVWAAPEGGAG
ncbi:class F sortase [Demequina pelophila]|uniref:class F sortase n=1 Tax=Demequina pelophila TaxID=1638984 RepID=UPI0007854952|nr:class F sortase [Demequina pelophila]